MTVDESALVDAVRRAGVRDARVIDAFRVIPRERFVPRDWVIARMVEALELTGEEEPAHD